MSILCRRCIRCPSRSKRTQADTSYSALTNAGYTEAVNLLACRAGDALALCGEREWVVWVVWVIDVAVAGIVDSRATLNPQEPVIRQWLGRMRTSPVYAQRGRRLCHGLLTKADDESPSVRIVESRRR